MKDQSTSSSPRSQQAAHTDLTEVETRLRRILTDPLLRLNSIYKVRNPHGQIVPFRLLREQRNLLEEMHYLNLIVKARQLGITTFIQIFLLDQCLFHPNISCGVIAHTQDDARRFFRDKIKFAYDHLPVFIKDRCAAKADNAGELLFENGSRITVSSSARSDTLQYLHVSELGFMSVFNPVKANEVISGSLNTVTPGQIVFIESTSEGPFGVLHDMTKQCLKKEKDGSPLTKMDYKLHFFPWHECERYHLDEPACISDENQTYFDNLEEDDGIVLSHGQKTWYVKKRDEQGDNIMVKQFPSTIEEAFQGVTEGAVYGKQMRKARRENRICRVPHLSSLPVTTFWDLGRRDMTGIWFHQRVGVENRFIRYIENNNESLDFYAKLLEELHEELGYSYDEHYLPHDIEIVDLSRSDNLSRHDVLVSLGVKPIEVVEKIAHEEDGIEMLRQVFPTCYFDEENCERGIEALGSFRYEKDEKRGTFKPKPKSDWSTHACDALRQFAQGYRYRPRSLYDEGDSNPMLRENRSKQRRSYRGSTSGRRRLA